MQFQKYMYNPNMTSSNNPKLHSALVGSDIYEYNVQQLQNADFSVAEAHSSEQIMGKSQSKTQLIFKKRNIEYTFKLNFF